MKKLLVMLTAICLVYSYSVSQEDSTSIVKYNVSYFNFGAGIINSGFGIGISLNIKFIGLSFYAHNLHTKTNYDLDSPAHSDYSKSTENPQTNFDYCLRITPPIKLFNVSTSFSFGIHQHDYIYTRKSNVTNLIAKSGEKSIKDYIYGVSIFYELKNNRQIGLSYTSNQGVCLEYGLCF